MSRPPDGGTPRRQAGRRTAASRSASTSRASSAHPLADPAVVAINDGSSAAPIPAPAEYGPCSRKLAPAATATATAPHPASRRRGSEAHPPDQQTSASTGTPTASARPPKPGQRTVGSAVATPGSLPPSSVAASTGTRSAFPTAKENAPAIGCESADTTR